MPRKAYSTAQKREAVAHAHVMGVAAAAESLGIDPRTIAKWSAQAGDRPELDGNAAAWQRAFDLAHAKVEGFLATGKASAVSAATIMGIAQRNLRDIERGERPLGEESAVSVQEPFMDWLIESVPDRDIASEDALAAMAEAIDDVIPRLLLKRANAETPPRVDENTPHRSAILAWHSGRTEIPAGDVLTWAQDQVRDVLAEHGSLTAWHARALAEEATERAERERMTADIQAKAKALREASVAAAHEARLDEATRELLAEAHRILRETADA